MKISKTHQKFSDFLEQPDALTYPEKYLGPNWEDVLNFWIYIDTLSYLEKREIANRYWTLNYNTRVSAFVAANNAAKEVVGWKFRDKAWCTAWDTTGLQVFGHATEELIGSHKLLEQGKTPTVLSLCVNN